MVLTLPGTIRGARGLLPVALFAMPFGVSFGVAALKQGMAPDQAIWMSLLAFTGMAQFASLDFLQASVPYLSLALVILAVNARHLVMGAAVSPWVNQLPIGQRILTLTFLTDPNFADSQPVFVNGGRDVGRLLGGGLVLWVMWAIGTVIGVMGGRSLGPLDAFGVDVVMLCFFTALVAGRVRQRRYWAPILIAGVAAVLLKEVMPEGWNILAAALMGGAVMALRGEERA